jgi:hypothetical protein
MDEKQAKRWREIILKWLLRSDLLYRQKLDPAELEELTDLWNDALESKNLTEEDFEEAMRIFMGENTFFPKPAEIIKLVYSGRCRQVREERAARALPGGCRLPEAAPVMPGISPKMKAVFARRDDLVKDGMQPFAALSVAMRERQAREEAVAQPRETEAEIRQ